MSNRYDSVNVIKSATGKRMHSSVVFPRIEPDPNDTIIVTSVGDRLDTLATKYYDNPRYWWVIASVNDLGAGTLAIPPGSQIRIPASPSTIIQLFEEANR